MKADNSETTRIKIGVYSSQFRMIQKAVAKFYGVPTEYLERRIRREPLMQARRHVCRMSRELLPTCPYSILGVLICPESPMDHASIRHNAQKMSEDKDRKTIKGNWEHHELREEVEKIDKYYQSLRTGRKRLSHHYRAMFKRSRRPVYVPVC
jgi:chromosomal replication initiation ATPase DnaA